MKSKNTLTLLAVSAAALLCACGSGGGKTPQTMPAPPASDKEQAAPQPQTTPAQPAPQQNGKPPVAAQPAPPARAPETAPKPQQPAAENGKDGKQPAPPAAAVTDQDVFGRLSLHTLNGVFQENLLKLVLDGGTKKISLDVMPPHVFTGTPKIETLRDMDGTLVGYYGYARVSEQQRDKLRDDEYARDRHFMLQHADSHRLQRPEGLGDITYNGKMFYQYKNNPNGAAEADVTARYSGKDKTLRMNIVSRQDGAWTLHQGISPKSPAFVGVGADGHVGGRLVFSGNDDSTLKPNGEFTGGFYGKNGSVLTGKAHFEDRENGWEGVVGAQAAPSP